MRQRAEPRLTLTNRLLALAALIVVVTSLLLTVSVAAGVYEMASREASARQAAYREILAVDLESRIASAARAVRNAAGDIRLSGDDPTTLGRSLAALTAENSRIVYGMMLFDEDGNVLASWPKGAVLRDIPAGLPMSRVQVVTMTWADPADPDPHGTLWATAPVRVPEGEQRVLVVRVRDDFVVEGLGDVARSAGSAIAFIVDDRERVVMSQPADALKPSAILSASADDEQVLAGAMRVETDAAYVGYYADLPVPPGPAWRVVVVEPEELAWRETMSALQPGIIGWAVALGVALIAALAVVTRVTKPLRLLEVRARALASGVRVEPAAIEARDELGRLLEAFNSIALRLDRLSDIAELLARASDRQLVLQGVTSSITHMLGSADVDVLLLAGPDALELVAAEGALQGREGVRIPVERVAWVSDALCDSEPMVVALDHEDALVALHGSDEASVLAVPLRAGEEIIGCVAVVRSGQERFTETERETVRSFAAQASVALQNSRLFEDERQSRREAEALRSIAERLASPLVLEEALADLGRTAADLLGMEGAAVILDGRGRFGLSAAPDPAADAVWSDVWEAMVAGGTGVEVPVVLTGADGNDRSRDALAADGSASAVLVPLRLDEDRVGLLVLTSSQPEVYMDAHRLALADTLGKQAVLALRNASLYEQATRRADNLETIFRISHAVASSLQSRIVLNRVLDVVQKILSADAVMLLTYDAQRKVMTVPMARGVLHRDMLETVFRPGEDVPGRVFETREPERFDRLSGTDTRLLNAAAEQGLQSLLAVPLLARGRSIGVLAAFARAESAFSSEDLDLLRTFASQAALAIDTAEMFSREHHVATVLQQSILPTRLPRISGIDVSSVYLPAVGDAEIGGDYYDLFLAPDGRVVVTIGDVCGKGVEAATKTSMIKYAIRGMVVAGLGPADVLRELNVMLMEADDPAGIVTLWIGYLDVASGVLSYANGGHPPALVFDPSGGTVARLATTGALLGAVEDTEWAEACVIVPLGAAVLLYTDGVTEARSGGRFFGEGRVRRALRQGGTAADIAQRLLDLVQTFASGDLRDDAAILTVLRTG